MLPPLHALQYPHCRMLTSTGQFLTELYKFTLTMPNNISHSSMLWQNYFITFEIVITCFLFKSVCNRNETLVKNSSKLLKVFKHGLQFKLGYLLLVSRYCKSLHFIALKFFLAISYLHKNRRAF